MQAAVSGDVPSYREESVELRADELQIARREGEARQAALHRHVGEDAPVDQQQLHAYSLSSSPCQCWQHAIRKNIRYY